MVKNLPAVQETQVQSLGQEDPLEKEMAHSIDSVYGVAQSRTQLKRLGSSSSKIHLESSNHKGKNLPIGAKNQRFGAETKKNAVLLRKEQEDRT